MILVRVARQKITILSIAGAQSSAPVTSVGMALTHQLPVASRVLYQIDIRV